MKTLKLLQLNLLYILLCAVFAISCKNEPKQVPEKPFIIIFKYPRSAACNKGFCRYEYVDKNGNVYSFCEDEKQYYLGDTIK